MAHDMSTAEWQAFLMEGTRTAKLAVARKSGAPHVVPVWFVLDGDDVVLTTGRDTVKGRSIRRDGRVALCVDDERPPFSFVSIEGTATIVDDPAALLHWATQIGARYMGAGARRTVRPTQRGPRRAARTRDSAARRRDRRHGRLRRRRWKGCVTRVARAPARTAAR